MEIELLQKLGVALVLSILVGVEREKRYRGHNEDGFGGIRTFALIGLFGALSYLLLQYSYVFFSVLSLGFFGLVIAMYVMSARQGVENLGATSEIAAMIVYIVGVLSAMGLFLVATAVTLAVLLILYFKESLHKWANNIQKKELNSTIEFIVIAFVILPLLPNAFFGPYDFFNPYVVWLMVVFISGLSFLSYIAIRIFGPKRGISLTGFLAGFISSTALTITYSSDSKKNRGIVHPYVIAVIVASSAMFFRVIVEVLVVGPDIFYSVLIPMLSMGGAGVISVLFFWFGNESFTSNKVEKGALAVKSPFNLMFALKFGLFFALILFVTKFANDFMGDHGIYITSVFSGILDVDAITLSIANLVNQGLAHKTAVVAITLATMTNTLVKAGILLFWGSRKVSLRVFGAFVFVVLVGVGSLFFV